MKEIKIEGFTSDLTPDDRPALSLFGKEGTGKTRLAATAPDPIGLLPLDKKSKRTFEMIASQFHKRVLTNKQDFLTSKDAITLAMLDCEKPEELKTLKEFYTERVKRVWDAGMTLAAHPDVQTIVVDTNSQLFDWMLFSHFGRRNQIKPTSRGAVNQDMIDFINALRGKNLVLIHRAKEIWKDTGARDKDGMPIQAPSGKFEAEGFNRVGYFVMATLELRTKPAVTDPGEKFRVRVEKCQTNALLEGQDLGDYGVQGEEITWDNIVTAIGF